MTGVAGAALIRLLTVTTLYPNAQHPHHGVFVENRLRHLVDTGEVTSTVLAPVAWYPSWGPTRPGWSDLAGVAAVEQRHGLAVHHPRYAAIPRVGMTVAPALLAAGALAWLARLGPAARAAIDLVDAHYVYPDGVAALAVARALRRPLVITARGSDVTQLPDYRAPRLMIRQAVRRADGLVAVSTDLGERLVGLGADPARVRVLRNGVELGLFHPPADRAAARRALGLHGPTLLSVGHLIERKGHGRVIAALARLPDATSLLVVGAGPLDGALHALVERLGLGARVRFLGLLPPASLPAVYGAVDALVLASSREGWANVLLEAMACGTPAVASPIPGNIEVVREPAAGLVAAANTAESLADAVTRLLAAPPRREDTRAYAERFGWDEVSAGQLALFRAVLARHALSSTPDRHRDATPATGSVTRGAEAGE